MPDSIKQQSSNTYQLRWWWAIALAYTLAMVQRMAPASLSSTLAGQYQLDWAAVGLFSSAYFVVYLVLQIPAGIACDRFGARKILRWSVAISAAGALLQAFAPNYSTCLAGRSVTAVGDALVFSALIKATAIHFPKKRFALMMSVAQMAGYAGTAIAATPLLLFATKYGLADTYLSITGVLAVIFAFVVFQMPETAASPSTRTRMDVRQVLVACRPTLVAFAAYYAAYMTVFASWGSVFLTTGFLLQPYAASSAVLLGVFGLAAGGFLNGALLAREWEPRILMTTFAIVAAIVFALILVLGRSGYTTPLAVMLCLTMIGVCFGGISNGLTATVRERVQTSELSFASSIHAVLANLAAAVLMPVIGGQLTRPSNELQVLFAFLGAGCLLVVAGSAIKMLTTTSRTEMTRESEAVST